MDEVAVGGSPESVPTADRPPAQFVHDLRSRLTAVKGAWATLLLFDEQLHPDVRFELMEMVTRNVDLAVALVDQLLPGPQLTVPWPSSSAPPPLLSGFDGLTGVAESDPLTDPGTSLP
jgi:hypothetical protein